MANLIGYMRGNRGKVSRLGTDSISATLETWSGAINTELRADGSFAIYVGPKSSGGHIVATGNVNDGDRTFVAIDRAHDGSEIVTYREESGR